MEYVTLSNGVKMPVLGYGVYQVTQDECERCVMDALEVGYRSIDTAQSYFNEEQVGSAIQKSGVKREDIFLTSKVWVEHYGYDECRKSVEDSLRKLQTDYIDLMLLHQPFADYYGAYRALEDMYDEGKLRAIGISNFYPDRMVDIASFARIRPMVNQVETHPTTSRLRPRSGWTSTASRLRRGHPLAKAGAVCSQMKCLPPSARNTERPRRRSCSAGISSAV